MKEVFFNGKSSLELGLKVIGWKRPLLPEKQDHYERIPGRPGAHLFPQPYGTRPIEIEFAIIFTDIGDWMDRTTEIAYWLHSVRESRLQFDDEPGTYYMAMVGAAPIPDHARVPYARFTVQFICQPFKLAEQLTEVFTEVQANQEITLENPGTYMAEPKITIELAEGITDKLEVTVNEEAFLFEPLEPIDPGTVIEIDTEALAFSIDGQIYILEISGTFPALKPGENAVAINKAVDKIRITWQPRYL